MTKMRKRAAAAVGGVAIVAALAVPGVAAHAAAVAEQDNSFMTQAAQVNLAEITIGKLALQKANTPQVRSLAQETLTDHQDAQGKLERLAEQKGVTLPSSPNAQQQSTGKQLEGASGTMFDSIYLHAQISGHQEASTLTRSEIDSGRDADVQSFAKDFLPAVLRHLSHAQEAANALGIPPKGANTGSGGLAERAQSSTGDLGLVAGGLAMVVAAGAMLLRWRRRTG
ncbi:putative membrane protein [Saccharopolyspora spinosa]|uniref:Membrane protein n=2 Tax=Saccharopolyspora spinosa TaxID=60894 RepID=A0A2N3Y5N0_SACSN|nr:putative membrane protein [Saccharopolyspora spinosa]